MFRTQSITKALKAAGLTPTQIDYAKVLLRMGRTLEQAIEEASKTDKEPMREIVG